MISPEEIEIAGSWVHSENGVVHDEVFERIDGLIKSYLQEIARDPSGWNILYRDPNDGRLWERVFLQSELHGGGPQTLRVVTVDKARLDYGL